MYRTDARRRLPPAPVLLAAAAVALCAAANLWHNRAGTAPPTFDAAWYLENACRFYHALREGGFSAFYRVYSESFRFKAPLISVLPLPAFYLFGPSHDAALLVNIAAMALLAAYLYRLGERLASPAAGLMAVSIAMTMPLLFGLSRSFLVEYWLAALVAGAIYHLDRSDGLRRMDSARRLGALIGFGLLLKSLFPLYLLAPAADILLRRRGELGASFWRELERPLKTVCAIAGAIALSWYAHNLVTTAGYALRAGFGDIAGHYGSTRVFSAEVLLGYWLKLINGAFSPYYCAAALAVGSSLALRERGRLGAPLKDPAFRAVALWFLLPLAVATFGVNKDVRFLAPSLPAAALLLAAGLDRLTRGRPLRWLVLPAFFVFPANYYVHQSFGPSLLPPLSLGPLLLLAPSSQYAGPPFTGARWRQQWLVDEIRKESGAGAATVVLGLEHVYLNANTLAYFAARRGYSLEFIHYGYEESRIERTVARLQDRDADFLLLVDGMPEGELPQSARTVDRQVRELVASGRLPFVPHREFSLSAELKATLYKRSGEIRLFGAPGANSRPEGARDGGPAGQGAAPVPKA